MYVTREQAENLIHENAGFMKQEYLSKFGFLTKLLEDDDWSFVIKAHSLIEAVVTDLIISRIGETELKEVIERMPLHGETVSKLHIAKKYNLIDPDNIKFIIKVSEVRNKIVHKFENVNFTFSKYFESMDNQQIKSWKTILVAMHEKEDKKQKLGDLFINQPVYVIFFALFDFLNKSLFLIGNNTSARRLDEEANKTTRQLLEQLALWL